MTGRLLKEREDYGFFLETFERKSSKDHRFYRNAFDLWKTLRWVADVIAPFSWIIIKNPKLKVAFNLILQVLREKIPTMKKSSKWIRSSSDDISIYTDIKLTLWVEDFDIKMHDNFDKIRDSKTMTIDEKISALQDIAVEVAQKKLRKIEDENEGISFYMDIKGSDIQRHRTSWLKLLESGDDEE